MASYLVTGGAGFIGSHVVRDLIEGGEQVVIYDLFPQGDFLGSLLSEEQRTRVKIVQGDVCDLPHLMHTAKDNNVEVTIHLAGLLSEMSKANPHLAIKVNCEGTANVFEMVRLLELKKVVWASSMAVFGSPENYPMEYIPNDAPHYPWGLYGACKSFNEHLSACYFDQFGVDATGLRYCLVYGAGEIRGLNGMFCQELFRKPAMGKPGRVLYADDSPNWLYVRDAARATVLASKTLKPKTKVFTVTGDNHPVKEVAEYVRKILPSAEITFLAGRTGLSWKFDTASIKEEIGYCSLWSMVQGAKEVINLTRSEHGLGPV
jgi:UDP-glucose 4-epimerase